MQSPKAAWYTAFEPLEQPKLFTLESQNKKTKDFFFNIDIQWKGYLFLTVLQKRFPTIPPFLLSVSHP